MNKAMGILAFYRNIFWFTISFLQFLINQINSLVALPSTFFEDWTFFCATELCCDRRKTHFVGWPFQHHICVLHFIISFSNRLKQISNSSLNFYGFWIKLAASIFKKTRWKGISWSRINYKEPCFILEYHVLQEKKCRL